jgi:hypothetical protein
MEVELVGIRKNTPAMNQWNGYHEEYITAAFCENNLLPVAD